MKDPAEWAYWVQVPPTRGMLRVTFEELRELLFEQTSHDIVKAYGVTCCFCKKRISEFSCEMLSGDEEACSSCLENYLDGLGRDV